MENCQWTKVGDNYKLTQDLTWEVGKKNSGLLTIIPKGFSFESSVPKPLWWLWSPDDPYFLKAAAIHDWLLENGYRPAFAAGEWYDAAKSVHAPRLRRLFGFMAVALWTLLTERQRK